MDMGTATHEVVVVGSGPAGLATAAELKRRGVEVLVLERGDRLGAAWSGRYDGLRFNTSRWWSALPGAPFPKEFGWFPTRDQYVGYLEDYAARHDLTVRTGVEVRRLDPSGAGWTLRLSNDGADRLAAAHVVVATGALNLPSVPDWASGTPYRGSIVHASSYRNPDPYRDRRVLVVGPGSSGLEIARQLAEGGVAQVLVAVRTPPNLLPRVKGGLPFDLPVPLFFSLPVAMVDAMLRKVQRATWGDLSPYGLPPSPEGTLSGLLARGAGTAIVDEETVQAVREGRIQVVAGVERLDETGAVLTDGTRQEIDDVVLATGYRTGLEPIVGHLDVLGERGLPLVTDGGEALPGLRFVGYVYRPGLTGYVGKLARRAALEIARTRRRAVPVPA
ncbi:NAD(P)/FAD-dependent oxidoreductase [Ornithinimicrobium avium]|uniref:NAD(P)/FAD-dependent oxidoreductase n=2 Tax=Ornithinimicrobium avium TaxID=2283195 RepID=A0A345NPK7_9MICO|nr:NAD(P)/FAD-dependent oxidoreductase [Ornithinimicrobium avium]